MGQSPSGFENRGRGSTYVRFIAFVAAITATTGLVFHFHVTGLVVLLVIVLCTVPHGIALGGIPWLMMSELRGRNTGMR